MAVVFFLAVHIVVSVPEPAVVNRGIQRGTAAQALLLGAAAVLHSAFRPGGGLEVQDGTLLGWVTFVQVYCRLECLGGYYLYLAGFYV